MFSRWLGLVRDILMAGLFGTSLSMSAFVVAFTIPNLFRRLFGEGALSAAFVPVFIQTRQQEGEAVAWALARKVLTLLAVFLSALVVLGWVVILVWERWPELSDKTALILPLLRIMLPYMLFICMAALCMSILNAYHHFATSSFSPSILNIVWIFTLLYICPRLGVTPEIQIYGVAWAILLAGILQWAAQIPKMMQFGYRFGYSLDWKDARVKRVFRLMGPASVGMAVTQINVLIDRLMAASIGPWAPAALFFSERLIYFPQGIFATALGTVLLPAFSGHAASANHPQMLRTIHLSLRNLLYVMIPASIGLLVLARPIVQMIFEWRTFSTTSTDYTTVALMFYAPGLLVFSLSKVLVPAFYALQDTRTPVRVAMGSVALKLALSVLFILTWPTAIKHGGLALATVLGEAVSGTVLAILLHRRLGSPGWKAIGTSALRCLVASAIMAGAAWSVCRWVMQWGGLTGTPDKVIQIVAVLIAISVAMVVYLMVTLWMGAPEIHDVVRALRRRFGRKA